MDKDKLNQIADEIVRHAKDFRNAAENVAAMNEEPQIRETAVGVVTSLIDLVASGDKHLGDPNSSYLADSHKTYQDAMLLMQG